MERSPVPEGSEAEHSLIPYGFSGKHFLPSAAIINAYNYSK